MSICKIRVGALAVLAIVRMKYMVNRWHRKRTCEGSPESEYNMSRHTSKIDPNILRPAKGVLVNNNGTGLPFSATSAFATNNNLPKPGNSSCRDNIGDLSEYLTRFESIENEISSNLSRNLFPS